MSFDKAAALHAECFPNKKWSAADFSELKESGAEIVMSDNGFIVWRVAADEAEIITIGVLPAARRMGVASALVRIMESELAKKKIERVFLEVAKDNAAAIGLYEKNGFRQVGLRPKYYDGKDGIIMAKELGKKPCVAGDRSPRQT